ncbi:hypothetical protein P168DRAFT_288632 [Aspergillus campestris IBT 28561]|uniref:SWI/SNF family DNA-dependent ATPase Ris1 n=1 Tax=Aspergillus campestris (strain IBT 28561) TaxID=1392248 RepID=A0A2I1DA28_ASPC2|nr:uncharacterized protein P168DRAFT_288632 [Aspergillus campestris IBT 28561]PKY06718.1 hypothetical protein P168DRAFT_288632 [Aspergillus campestris IBT 28561]
MASPTSPSIDDILDDIELNHVILQSLDEERPDAVEDRQDIVNTIRNLEARLAELRGEPQPSESRPPSPPFHQPSGESELSRSQLDGSADNGHRMVVSPPHGRFAMSPPPRPGPPGQGTTTVLHSLGSSSAHKRPHTPETDASDDTDDLERPPPKRTLLSRPSPRPDSRDLPDPSFEREASAESQADDSLMQLLNLSGSDLQALEEAQKELERDIQRRKEQERQDEELARKFEQGYWEPPSSSQSTPSHYSDSPLPSRPQQTNPVSTMDRHPYPYRPYPNPTLPNPPPRHVEPSALHSMGPSSSQRPAPIYLADSDDSDIAEITAGDFRRHAPSQMPRMTDRPTLPPLPGQPSHAPYHNTWMNSFRNFSSLPSLPNPYASLGGPSRPGPGSGPGPGDMRGSTPMFGPHVLHSTMARLNQGKQMLEDAGRSAMADLNKLFPNSKDGVDPKKVNEEIKQLLETIRPDSDIDLKNREGTPEALKLNLLEHQKLGLAWMKTMEENEQKGGVLADDMGLGKTIQAIALMVSRPSTDLDRKPTLIVAPVALLQQWKREIERTLRPGKHQLKSYVLHGERRTMAFRDLKHYDVILTTFGTLSSELRRREKYDELHASGTTGEAQAKDMLKSMPCLGPSSKWHRIIIDEAQCIKNRHTKAALACCRVNSTYRWCMTGTPMMNNVEELHSLLKFLRIRPYNSLERFTKDFTRPLKSGSNDARDKAMRQLQVLLKAVLLRRTKESKIDGKPILQLPPRVSEKIHAVFSEDELELYRSLETKTQLQFNKYLAAGTVGRNYSNILVLLLRLRQACCHPHLISDFSVQVNANTDEVDLIANAKAFGSDVVIRLKDNDDLECPCCMDAVDNPLIFFPCGHSTCAECFSRLCDPARAVSQGHDGSVEARCPNCRRSIDPKKNTDHVSFRKVHYNEGPDEAEQPEPAQAADDDPSDDDSDDNDDDGSLSRFIVDDDGKAGSSTSTTQSKRKGKAPTKTQKKTIAELKKEASKNQKSKRKYLRRLEKTWVPSAKIDKTLEILESIHAGEAGEKTIIFSQFTSLLDFLEVPIMRRGWGYKRYDGSMKPADRNTAVLEFTDNPDCRVMLVSLKAGNAGLNLIAASQVIIFDPFWNPYIEEQAIDRAHRIGQQRKVQIHRILVENTVEDRILELQDKKRELIEGALDENASKNVSRLGTRELAYLFGVH